MIEKQKSRKEMYKGKVVHLVCDDIVLENVETKNIDGAERASVSRKRYYKTNNEAVEVE